MMIPYDSKHQVSNLVFRSVNIGIETMEISLKNHFASNLMDVFILVLILFNYLTFE